MSVIVMERRAVSPSAAPAATSRSVWRVALPFAVVLAAADGFWVTAMRGAVGAIQRSGNPMRDYLVQSSLMIPLYLAAVLAAVAVARRRRWSGMRAAGLVAGFGTVAGFVHLLGDSIFDYKLQNEHLSSMGTMGGLCLQSCLHHEWLMTWHLQVRAVILGAGILAVTNVVAVLWLLALRGGRLDVRGDAKVEDALRPVTITMVAGTVAVTVIHAAVIPEHLAEWWAAGTFFIVLTLIEAVNAWLLLRRPPSTATLLLTVAVAFVPLVAWSWSRATGLPFGPEAWEPEAVGLPDVICSVLELVVLLQAIAMLAASTRRTATISHTRTRLAVVALLAVTLIGAGNPLGLFGSAGHHGEEEQTPVTNSVTHFGPLNAT